MNADRRRYWLKRFFALLVLGFVLFNALAYRQAYTMLHYTDSGEQTPKPENLSGLDKIKTLLTGVTIPRPEAWQDPSVLGLDYEVVRISVHDEIELEGWYLPSPNATIVALVFHGYMSEKSALLAEAQLLHESGYDVLLLDFRGSGGSSESVTTIGYLEAEDVAASFRYARERWPDKKTLLVGQSMGAAAILRAAHNGTIQPDYIVAEAIFDTMLGTLRNRFQSMHLPSFPAADLLLFWSGVQTGFNGFKHNPVDYARKVEPPVLFFHGVQDPRTRPEQARRVYEAIPGVKAWHTFEGVGHVGRAAAFPGTWKNLIDEFVNNE